MKYVYCLLLLGCSSAAEPMLDSGTPPRRDSGVVVADSGMEELDAETPPDVYIPPIRPTDSGVDSGTEDASVPRDSGVADSGVMGSDSGAPDAGCDAGLLMREEGRWCFDRLALGPECFAGSLGLDHCAFMQRRATNATSECYASCPSGTTVSIEWSGTRRVVFCDTPGSC